MTKVKRKLTKAQKATKAALQYGYRSGLEGTTADYLDAHEVPFEYEKLKIKWVDHKTRTYTPDFELLDNGIIIETKGRFVVADRMKHIAIREQYPMLDIRFVFSNANAKISKTSSTMYRQWCERHGFKWANKEIPEEWLKEPHVGFDIKEYISRGV